MNSGSPVIPSPSRSNTAISRSPSALGSITFNLPVEVLIPKPSVHHIFPS